MNKLKLIIIREFYAKVRNKTFIVMTLLSPIIMVLMIGIVAYLTKGTLDKKNQIAIVDHSKIFSKIELGDTNTVLFQDFSNFELKDAKVIVEESSLDGLLFIPAMDSIQLIAKNIQFFSTETPSLVLIAELESLLQQKLQESRMLELDIDIEKLKKSKVDISIQMNNFIGEKSSKLINGVKIGLGMGAGYMIMMFIIIYGAMVMRSVIEEKTSRIIEVIISSVKPFELMLGKIFGTAMAGLLQFIIWGVLLTLILTISSFVFGFDYTDNINQTGIESGQLDVLQNGENVSILNEILGLPLFTIFASFLIYFLAGYLLYSSIYAAIGAAVDNETDTQQFMLPVIMPLIIAVYVGFATVINDPHGGIATLFSMIPFTSPIVMLMRIPFGVPWWQILISLLILFSTFLGVVWVAAKIYRVGILMYGKKASYKELYKWIKY